MSNKNIDNENSNRNINKSFKKLLKETKFFFDNDINNIDDISININNYPEKSILGLKTATK